MPITDLEDYVAKELRGHGIDIPKGNEHHSNAGTAGLTNWDYICPGGNPYVGHPWSKEVLDKEAVEYAERCCKKRQFCGKKVCVVMVAPKTATLPPKNGCCKLDIRVWWDPYDPVPNQGIKGNAALESQAHWGQYGQQYPVDSGRHGFLGIQGNHNFKHFLKPNPLYDKSNEPKLNPLDTPKGWPNSGQMAPNPIDVIKQFKKECDMTIVCHSQGCNITMQILNRACKK